MKKIYYLQKHEVKLGDVIEYAGIRTILTEELIELNPELFIVKDTMQELIDEAKRRYPIGTVYKHFNNEYTINSPDMLTVSKMDHHFEGLTRFGISIWVRSEEYNGVVYHDGEWAEIIPIKFTTEDGVNIYGDMKTYLVHPNDSGDIRFWHCSWDGGSKGDGNKYFYHKENALAYIKKHKEKTLEDYEQMLFKKDDSMTFSPKSAYFSVYGWIKDNEPKLYYTKILQLIADDLNDGWEPDFTNYDEKWCVAIKDIVHYVNLQIHGIVYFKESKLAQKAKDILGDKVNYLFNQA